MKLNLVVLVSLVLCAGCGINSGSGGAPQQVKAVGTGAASTSANTHYLSPTGNDSNDGVSESTPWLTTFHSGLNCGTDNILALPSTAYTPSQFSYWGTVTCPSQNNVVWLQCATFDACTMTIPAGSNAVGMWINRSFWGVQGFEIDSLSKSVNGQTCFNVSPPSPSSPPIRNVIFANNVAINCPAASFGAG